MSTTTEHPHRAEPPPIQGLALRRFRDPADYAAMAGVAQAASLQDEQDFIPDAANLKVDFENTADLEPRRDIVLAEVDGQLVAWGSVMRQVRDGLAVYQTTGTVHPEWRRRGLGRWILRTNEAHIRDLAQGLDDPDGRAYGSWCSNREIGAVALLPAEGYSPVRYGFAMHRPTLDDIPGAPLPPGLDIREVRPKDHRAIWEADDEAFRDHWGHREQTEEDFTGLFAIPDLDTRLWSVAWDGDEVAGSVQTFVWKSENDVLGVRRGWLEHISVRRPWRRRGVARALIADALRRLRAAGMDQVMLGVDSENATGALELYRSLGFEVKDSGATYRKAWEPGGRLV